MEPVGGNCCNGWSSSSNFLFLDDGFPATAGAGAGAGAGGGGGGEGGAIAELDIATALMR